MDFLIRTATTEDANAIGQLSAQSADYLRRLGDQTNFKFNAMVYLRDGFGPNPAFAGLVAELAGQVIGYLLYHLGYDVDRAIRQLHVIDLYVQADVRSRGVGKALMQEAARICHTAGCHELFWAVYASNQLAARFYERLGARYITDLRYMVWQPEDNG